MLRFVVWFGALAACAWCSMCTNYATDVPDGEGGNLVVHSSLCNDWSGDVRISAWIVPSTHVFCANETSSAQIKAFEEGDAINEDTCDITGATLAGATYDDGSGGAWRWENRTSNAFAGVKNVETGMFTYVRMSRFTTDAFYVDEANYAAGLEVLVAMNNSQPPLPPPPPFPPGTYHPAPPMPPRDDGEGGQGSLASNDVPVVGIILGAIAFAIAASIACTVCYTHDFWLIFTTM